MQKNNATLVLLPKVIDATSITILTASEIEFVIYPSSINALILQIFHAFAFTIEFID